MRNVKRKKGIKKGMKKIEKRRKEKENKRFKEKTVKASTDEEVWKVVEEKRKRVNQDIEIL